MPDPDFTKEQAFIDWKNEAALKRDELLKSAPRTFEEKVWQSFKNRILVPYHGRCAYCEGLYTAGDFGDAEHYRPKSEVTENRQKIASHPGYYWLVYEWQNLLLSCRKCNSRHSETDPLTGKRIDSHPGKLCEFPVSASRICTPNADPERWMDELKGEEPLLLHPYHDNPEDHFFAVKDGRIWHKTLRGQVTINVCDLNRKVLRIARSRAEENVDARAYRIFTSDDFDLALQQHKFGPNHPFSTYLNSKLRETLKSRLARMGQAI
ncbi:MAG TPA: hypothetical protein VGL72_16995, partial [Bryobacteraceae bacterium]